MMQPAYNEATRPRMQLPIQRIKDRNHHEHWLLLLAHEVTYQLAIVQYRSQTDYVVQEWSEELPYSEFWHHLRRLKLERGKYWLIGHQVRYVLERTFILQALENEEIKLPKPKQIGGPKKRAGRLTYSSNCLEIDVVAGRNRLKILDWENFGVSAGAYGVMANEVTTHIAEQIFKEFLDACDCFGFSASRSTTAQLGWASYRQYHLPPILSANMSAETRALERRSYFGGRNEPFYLGDTKERVYLLDVNSYYASLCKTQTFPIHCVEEYFAGLDFERIDCDDAHHWIADCIIKTEEPDYPMRWGGLPVYPVGTFKTTLAWPELRHALYIGRVQKILKATRYQAGPIFKSYASSYLNQRKLLKGTPYLRMQYLLKSAFNASLGYTARRKFQCVPWETHIGLDWFIGQTLNPETQGEIVQCQILAGQKEWVKIGGEPREAMPFLHTTICSYGRMQLLNLMNIAGRDHVLYVDTDGMIVTEAGYRKLLECDGTTGDAAGRINMRFDPGKARIQGQKNYRIGKHVVCAGLVRTRHSSWEEKTLLTTTTGRTSTSGRVYPYEFRCVDSGDGEAKYVNELA